MVNVHFESVFLFMDGSMFTFERSPIYLMTQNRYSLLPALSVDGILHAQVIEGSFTAEWFREFIDGLLLRMQPFPADNSVVVMDNARIHKGPEIADLITSQ